MTLAQTLATGWIKHFYAADQSIKWGRIEHEHSLWLDDKTLLVGRIDADGETEDGDFFFADWKTISGNKKNQMASVKAEYRLDPQMLTYGLLTSGPTEESCAGRFMVRWAMKPVTYATKSPTGPLYFYEWYSYTAEEIAWWRNMVRNIAAKIRADKLTLRPFITNLSNCLRYGANYACPFLAPACSKRIWDGVTPEMTKRTSHLDLERGLQARNSPLLTMDGTKFLNGTPIEDVVILDATRIDTWLGCNERYRREYLTNDRPPSGEALSDGIEFHDLMHTYYNGMKEKQNG